MKKEKIFYRVYECLKCGRDDTYTESEKEFDAEGPCRPLGGKCAYAGCDAQFPDDFITHLKFDERDGEGWKSGSQ